MAIPTNNRIEKYINDLFPNICHNYEVLGHNNVAYNCVAFACDDLLRYYWPCSNPGFGHYWPPGIPNNEDLHSFIALFQKNNYIVCGLNEKFENGYEKVAIYVDDNAIPTHVAKQCITDNGCWRSKLSGKHLIKHTLGGLSGLFPGKAEYGNVAIILKRKCQIVKQGIFK